MKANRALLPISVLCVLGVALFAPGVFAALLRNVGLCALHKEAIGDDVSSQPHTSVTWLERSNRWQETSSADLALAAAYDLMGLDSKADESIAQAEALSPKNSLVLWTAGGFALQDKQQGRATDYYRRAGAGAYLILAAESQLKAGQLDEAAMNLELALAVDPQQARGWKLLGDIHSKRGATPEAIAAYERAASCDPHLAEAHVALARIYHDQGQIDQAISMLSKAAQETPEEASLYYAAAEALWKANRHSEALAWCELGKAQVLENWQLYFCSGVSLRRLDQPGPAIEQFSLAAERGADPCSMQSWIGTAYRDIGEFQKAIEALEAAKCGYTNIPWVYVELARTYERMGRSDLALAEIANLQERFADQQSVVEMAAKEMERLSKAGSQ